MNIASATTRQTSWTPQGAQKLVALMRKAKTSNQSWLPREEAIVELLYLLPNEAAGGRCPADVVEELCSSTRDLWPTLTGM